MHSADVEREDRMSKALDLEPIKARLAATTPGEWRWVDETLADVPYEHAWWDDKTPIEPGNDGALGVIGLFVEVPQDKDTSYLEAVLEATDDVPDDPDDPDGIDWSRWRGPIQVTNVADLEFITQAKSDIEALIAEVERLRTALDPRGGKTTRTSRSAIIKRD
jgi:hypothetical protein